MAGLGGTARGGPLWHPGVHHGLLPGAVGGGCGHHRHRKVPLLFFFFFLPEISLFLLLFFFLPCFLVLVNCSHFAGLSGVPFPCRSTSFPVALALASSFFFLLSVRLLPPLFSSFFFLPPRDAPTRSFPHTRVPDNTRQRWFPPPITRFPCPQDHVWVYC